MKIRLMLAVLLVATIMGGCMATPPLVMESGFQRKVITPCDNDILCFRHTYDVTWDNSCLDNSTVYGSPRTSRRCVPAKGYPVSYRSNEYIWETGSYGYLVTLPGGGAVRMIDNGQESNE